MCPRYPLQLENLAGHPWPRAGRGRWGSQGVQTSESGVFTTCEVGRCPPEGPAGVAMVAKAALGLT